MARAKRYEDLDTLVGGVWDGEEEMREIVRSIEARTGAHALEAPERAPERSRSMEVEATVPEELGVTGTPPEQRPNPELITLATPREPLNARRMAVPALVSGQDAPTPTPGELTV